MDGSVTIPPQISERYEVQRQLGRGGFATVHLAHDKTLKRLVALKVYHPSDDWDAASAIREAELLAQLQHHNIVRIYDAKVIRERDKPDKAYLVMEYLSGRSLREKLRPGGPPMRPRDALGLIAVLAEALQAAHEQDILHLDIKPENILFDRVGRPILTDFGIGRRMGGDDETKQTRAMGTNNYAAPEQRQGGKLVRATDIYSLGVVLFELLTNHLPLGPAAAHPQPPFSPPFPMGHPLTAAEDLVLLVCKALAVAPEYRYESAQDFAQASRDYLLHAGGDTKLFAGTTPRPFAGPPIAQVAIHEPERDLRPSERPHQPRVAEEMERDLQPLLPGTRATGMIYSHQAFEAGRGSVVEQGIFARGMVRLRQDAVVKGDVMSLTRIDISQGVQAGNLLAPELLVRGPIRLAGSIFCRRLRPAQGEGESATHLPGGSTLGGSLIFGEAFETIVPDDELGRPLAEPRPSMEIFRRPMVRIGSQCTLVAVLGEVDVVVEERQKQLNTIRVQGNVFLGRANVVRRIEGHDVHIASGCTVDEVYAEGKLIIGANSKVGYVRACEGIELADGVSIASPILFSANGRIIEKEAADWVTTSPDQQPVTIPLTAEHLFDDQRDGGRGSLATILMDHRLHELYERLARDWMPSLRPTAYEGTGEQVRQPGRPRAETGDEEEGDYASFPLDLSPERLPDEGAEAAPSGDGATPADPTRALDAPGPPRVERETPPAPPANRTQLWGKLARRPSDEEKPRG